MRDTAWASMATSLNPHDQIISRQLRLLPEDRPAGDEASLLKHPQVAEMEHDELALGGTKKHMVIHLDGQTGRPVEHLLVAAAPEERIVDQARGINRVRLPVSTVDEERHCPAAVEF